MSEPSQNVPTTNTGARRRSSSWMPAFEALQNQKRGNTDMSRRQSMSDQHAKGGIFSQFFHNNFGRNAK
ncbi:hypothetical protein E4U42_000259 [Claviceps africana]|uniref:Conidiation-specific protein 8 n=1 Tax=Claviceps africana TaxID=83212 RepID=A0A8K0JAT4_9HYPO|nr:hypothetical protein E4U42_000259 [Claviceps africana]